MAVTPPLRIVHITPAGGFGRVQHGGAERAVLELAGQSALAGHSVTIIAPGEFLRAIDPPEGVRTIAAEIDPKRVLSLAKVVVELNPDVIVGHLLRGVIVAGAIRAISGRRAAFVTNLHNSLNQAFEDVDAPKSRRMLLRGTLRALHYGKRASTVAISRSNFDDLLEHDRFPSSKVELINNWVAPVFVVGSEEDAQSVKTSLLSPESSKLALFVGRLEHQKNPLLAVQAVAGLSTKTTLVVAGDGSLADDLVAEAERLDVELRLLGNVKDVERYMAAADVVLVPSRYEGFGRVAVEALATGTPVVANSVVGLRDALSPFPPEWYSFSSSEEPAEWTRLVQAKLDEPLDHELRKARRSRVMDTYGLTASVDRYLDLYGRLLQA